MDSNLPPANTLPDQPQNLKDRVSEASGEFVKNNYEGFARRSFNVIYALLKFIKNSLLSMIKMAINRE